MPTDWKNIVLYRKTHKRQTKYNVLIRNLSKYNENDEKVLEHFCNSGNKKDDRKWMKMVAFKRILFLTVMLPACVIGWKPIIDPSLKTYSKISQSHRSALGGPLQVAQSRASSTTYHGNHFPNHVARISSTLALDDIEPGATLGGKSISSSGGFFANKLHNGFLASVS